MTSLTLVVVPFAAVVVALVIPRRDRYRNRDRNHDRNPNR